MGKTVIYSEGRVFETLEEAAEALGLAVGTISRLTKEGRGRIKRVERVYAVKRKDGDWTIAGRPADNRGYVPLWWKGARIRERDVERVVDVTASWYGTGFESR